MVTRPGDSDRPNGRPAIPENVTRRIAARNGLTVDETRQMLEGFNDALDRAENGGAE